MITEHETLLADLEAKLRVELLLRDAGLIKMRLPITPMDVDDSVRVFREALQATRPIFEVGGSREVPDLEVRAEAEGYLRALVCRQR